MREVYVAAYRRDGDALDAVVRAAPSCKPDDVDRARPGGWHGRGDGFAAYPAARARGCVSPACDASIIPDARAIAELALPRLLAGEGVAAAAARSRSTCATASR